MKNTKLGEFIDENRLRLVGKEKRTHYVLPLGILGFISMLLSIHGLSYFGNEPNPVSKEEWWIIIILLTLSAGSYYWQNSRLKFKVIKTRLSREELAEIIKDVAEHLEWETITNSKDIYQAKTNPSFFSGSWGERITIAFEFNEVWVNSICDPAKRSSMTAMGRNRKNVKVLLAAIKEKDPKAIFA